MEYSNRGINIMSYTGLKVSAGVAFVAAAAFGITNFLGNYEYSNGQRTGGVDKLSEKGIGCKTWEGQLAMDNLVAGKQGSMTNSFAFSVKDPAVVKQLQDAQQEGLKVSLTYAETVFHWPCEQDTDYEVTKVTALKNQGNKTSVNSIN
jgi:hypothetical protein